MAEDECMGMTVWAMLSSELGLVLLVVANFDESQKSELKTRTRAKLGLGMPKLEVNAPRREAHRSTTAKRVSYRPPPRKPSAPFLVTSKKKCSSLC